MTTPGMKTLENCAQATGCAFGFREAPMLQATAGEAERAPVRVSL